MSFNECEKLMQGKSFFEFVYGKIARDQKNRFVEKGKNYVDIIPYENESVRVIPVWKDININALDIQDEIDLSSTMIMNGEMNHVYLVYPKNDQFTKHIEIKIPILEKACKDGYKIKVIPYSLQSISRKKGKCNGNGNHLCK